MKDPTAEIMAAAKTQLDADLSGAGYSFTTLAHARPGTSLPYVRMSALPVLPRHNKSQDGTETYLQFDVMDDDYLRGLQIRGTVIQSLTDRSDPITTTNHYIVSAELDYAPAVIEDETPDGKEYSFPVRIQYRTREK